MLVIYVLIYYCILLILTILSSRHRKLHHNNFYPLTMVALNKDMWILLFYSGYQIFKTLTDNIKTPTKSKPEKALCKFRSRFSFIIFLSYFAYFYILTTFFLLPATWQTPVSTSCRLECYKINDVLNISRRSTPLDVCHRRS